MLARSRLIFTIQPSPSAPALHRRPGSQSNSLLSGYIFVPDGPGLGIEIDWEKVQALHYKIGWREYDIDHSVPDIHDIVWKNLSTGLQGVRKK